MAVTHITEAAASNRHNHVRKPMTRLRQLVSALMVLAMLVVLNAPLLACGQAEHQCAMMDHQMAQTAPTSDASPDATSDDAMAMPEHDCCPRKGPEAPAAPEKKSCHETAAVMPAECATSSNCCEMGNAPVVSVAQAAPVKKVLLAAISHLAPDPGLFARSSFEHASLERPPLKPVFELKADLRI